MSISRKGAHVGGCHRLMELLPLVHLYYYHVYTVEHVAEEDGKHHVKPYAHIQGAGNIVARAKDGKHGGIYGSTDHVHLPAVGVGGLYVVNRHCEKRETRKIDQYVDDGPHFFARGSESKAHLKKKMYCQQSQG